MLSSVAIAIALFLPNVAAHGYLYSIVIDNTTYLGTPMTGQTVPTNFIDSGVIRQVDGFNDDQVTDLTSSDLICGLNYKLARHEAPAKPGSKIEFKWVGSENRVWPHNMGPVMTYLASCGDGGCSTFNGSGASWFKIDQMGLRDASAEDWYVSDFHTGKSLYVTLPSNLAAGHYLFRSELIALHNAVEAEFYPACAQLNISNSNQSGSEKPNAFVSFSGAYSQEDPGIKIHGQAVYDANLDYEFPGGPVSNVRAIDDSAGGKDLTARSSSAHASDTGSSVGENSIPASGSQSTAVSQAQTSMGSTATVMSTELPATTVSTAPADNNTSDLASLTTAGAEDAKATCASSAAIAQRKRRSHRHSRAVDAVQDLRMAQAPHPRRWHS
ncbi:unnamed protein product [Peniophora sp. CBMAI 1063]|nr:unnamed protein product [Peniophora sp. CBMAI 1063]